MISLTMVRSRPSAGAFRTAWRADMCFVAKLWRDLFKELRSSYRPELHYMRGPGPRWREKHSAASRPDGSIQLSPLELGMDLGGNASWLDRANGEGILPDVGQHRTTMAAVPTQRSERRALAKRSGRDTETPAVIDLDRRRAPAREIVEARRALIAELEQRRRVPWDWAPELSQAA